MGGPGSGNWYRWDRKTTTDEVRRVDARHMYRHCGLSNPGSAGTLYWSCGGEPSGSINFRVHKEYVILSYKHRAYDEDWHDRRETIWLDRTPCNFGGERIWFLCPRCSRRVAVLCGLGVRFLCRECYGLPYASQSETPADRMARKARKLRRRLGADECLDVPIWDKPRGMHCSTYERLCVAEATANEAATAALAGKLALLLGIEGC